MVDTDPSNDIDTEAPAEEAATGSDLSINPLDVLEEVKALDPRLLELALQRAANKVLTARIAALESVLATTTKSEEKP